MASRCRSTAASAPAPAGEFHDHDQPRSVRSANLDQHPARRKGRHLVGRELDDESLKAAVDEAIDAATYNAITTDFWANLDLIGSQETWKMFGTGGDAKGQPTQTNSISHGSPHIRIKKIMVGAAYA